MNDTHEDDKFASVKVKAVHLPADGYLSNAIDELKSKLEVDYSKDE